jgi:hypothetical protein
MVTARRSSRVALLAGLVLAGVLAPPSAARACASDHLRMRLDAFPPEAASRPLYWAAEDDPNGVRATVRILNNRCAGETGTVSYALAHGTDSAADYAPPTFGQVTVTDNPGHPDYFGFALDPLDDVAPESLETGTLNLVGATGGALREPTAAAVVLVDTDQPVAQVSLAAGDYRQSESRPNGGVPVFRSGPTTTAVQVQFSVSPGGATPASAGDVSSPPSGNVTILAGQRTAMIPVDVVNDDEKETDETLEVSISGGTEVTGTTTVPFTIADNEETAKPRSSLHHPNNRRTYAADDYRIREIHVFTEDTGEAGVVAAEFALRRNARGGSCRWWTGRRFKKGGCDDERWLRTGTFGTDYFFYRLDQLKPSKGRIKNYSAFSRAIDGSNNIETRLEKGRNANSFEIKPAKG